MHGTRHTRPFNIQRRYASLISPQRHADMMTWGYAGWFLALLAFSLALYLFAQSV